MTLATTAVKATRKTGTPSKGFGFVILSNRLTQWCIKTDDFSSKENCYAPWNVRLSNMQRELVSGNTWSVDSWRCISFTSIQTREILLRHMRSCLSADPAVTAPLTSDTFPGNAQAKAVCPFCGKPTVPSSISSHLLVCKQKKQIQQNRLGETVPEKKRGSSAPISRPRQTERRVQSAVSRLTSTTKHTWLHGVCADALVNCFLVWYIISWWPKCLLCVYMF